MEDLDALIPSRKDLLSSIDRLLLYIYRRTTSAGEWVEIDGEVDYPVAFTKDKKALEFIIEKAKALGYLERPGFATNSECLDTRGWERVIELEKVQGRPNQAFVAMWLDPSMEDAYEQGIRPAIAACGYDALRIDKKEHNDKIDDEIVAEIRKSGLLVADFTGHRGGVYFEAGFAKGLGIPVIWSCRTDHFGKLHFDTRQYKHIEWTDPDDLRQQLQKRIEATHPRSK